MRFDNYGTEPKVLWSDEDPDCAHVLLDLLCYERRLGRLSPETKHLLDNHLLGCLACRRKVVGFEQVLTQTVLYPNFG